MLLFKKFELTKPNDCDSNFIDIFSERTDLPSRLKNFCGSIADTVQSNSSILHIRFFAEARSINSSFLTIFTAYREKSREEKCTPEEFDCEDNTCISAKLRCNNIINCKFRWDEDDCEAKLNPFTKNLQSDHIIIILVVFCLILSGMCFAFLFNCTRKLIRDHRIIQEHMRQTRDNELDGEEQKERQTALQATLQKITNLSTQTRSRSNSSVGLSLPHELIQNGVQKHSSTEHSISQHKKQKGDEGCYVPGGDIPIFDGRQDEYEGDVETVDDLMLPCPEMRDNECQTRESLFSNQLIDLHTNSDQSLTPPPPILHSKPSSHLDRRHPFSTFGYRPADERNHSVSKSGSNVGTLKKDEKRYRAEAVIEMESQKNDENSSTSAETNELRPFSIDSTKSAPDVIVTH